MKNKIPTRAVKSAKQKRNDAIEIRITNIREEMRQHYEQIMIDADKALEKLRKEREELKEANTKQNAELIKRNQSIIKFASHINFLQSRNLWQRITRLGEHDALANITDEK